MGEPVSKNDPLRAETATSGDLSLERVTYVEPGGKLSQDLSLAYKGEIVTGSMWTFEPRASHDRHLSVLDFHWKHLREEFVEAAEQMAYYFHVKTGGSEDGDRQHVFNWDAIFNLSFLLHQPMPDEELAQGTRQHKHYPLSCISQRLAAMRTAAKTCKIKTDRFEQAIMSLSKKAFSAVALYDQQTTGGEDDDELQYTAGENEFDDDEWRENNEDGPGDSEEDEWMRHQRQQQHRQSLEPWQDEDYDVDAEKEDKADTFLHDYVNYVVDFTNVANQIWMKAVMQIQDRQPVTVDQGALDTMQSVMHDTQAAYMRFKEATQDMAIGSYELQPVYEMLEDHKNGIQAKMQKIMSIASRPQELETIVKQGLPKARDR